MKKVYCESLQNEFDLDNLKEKNGEYKYKGKKLYLTQDAYPSDLERHEDEYTARAIDEQGNLYQVTWSVTYEYQQSLKLNGLEQELEELKSRKSYDEGEIARMEELESEIESMGNTGVDSAWCEDNSNACDWDKYSIESMNNSTIY